MEYINVGGQRIHRMCFDVGRMAFYFDHHNGQYTDFYRKASSLCAQSRNCPVTFSDLNYEWDQAREVYLMFCKKYGRTVPPTCECCGRPVDEEGTLECESCNL
jgi:hypothetical protein